MPAPYPWSEAEDELIRVRRASAVKWDVIAAEIGVCRQCVVDRAKRLGLWSSDVRVAATVDPDTTDTRDWWPLPAWHPITWEPISRGMEWPRARV